MLTTLLTFLDPCLIAPYRWPDSSSMGYLLGTAMLCLYCVILGDVSAIIVTAINRRRLREIQSDMDRHHALSEKALLMGDKESYKAVNRQAMDAFGYSFSLGAAIFSVSVWPTPFALAWLHQRFSQAPLELPLSIPFMGPSVHYVASFIALYMLIRVNYSKLMNGMSWYRSLRS